MLIAIASRALYRVDVRSETRCAAVQPKHQRDHPVNRPVPAFMEDAAALGTSLSTLGKTLAQGIREYADQNNIEIEGLPKDPNGNLPPELLNVLRNFLATIFPLLAPGRSGTRHRNLTQMRAAVTG